MIKYILKRIGYAILVLFGVSLIIYFLTRLMPIDFVRSKVAAISTSGASVSQDLVDKMYASYGLSEDAGFLDIMKGYFSWVGDLVRMDLGTSFKFGVPVAEKIAKHMGTSFMVALIATIFEFMIAIPLGITAATHQYSLRDYIVTVLVMIGISLPSFFFGNILNNWLALKLGWFPDLGLVDATKSYTGMALLIDYARHLFIPILTVVILSIGARMRMTRTNMLEVMNSDYIRTARAKGLKESVVINKHAFRNTLIPLVTSLAGLLPSLFSGAIITEQVFDLPGIGNIALQAMNAGDIPFIMGYNMFLAVLSVVGVLLADVMYAVVDPRVKLE
jgi:peptide/nickel transport system permease protein